MFFVSERSDMFIRCFTHHSLFQSYSEKISNVKKSSINMSDRFETKNKYHHSTQHDQLPLSRDILE
jgi:hypothetical protein